MPPFSVRKVASEVEANLAPVPGNQESAAATGKIEYKRYGDGTHRLKVRVRDLPVGGGALTLVIAGKPAAELVAEGKHSRLDIESKGPDEFPVAEPGDSVELRSNHGVVLAGVFTKD